MKRTLTALLLTAAWASPALASVYSYPRLTIDTGPAGQAVALNATIATLTTQPVGPPTVGLSTVTLHLPDFTGLFAEMDWSSFCEIEPGCVIAAPSEIDVTGFSGILQYYGPDVLLNGTLIPVGGMFVSGPLVFTILGGTYTDNLNLIGLSVPEPATWALFGVGLLGLGITARRRRA